MSEQPQTPPPRGRHRRPSRWRAQVPGRRAAVAAVMGVLLVGLLAPLLLLTSWAPGSPQALSREPAVQALGRFTELVVTGSPVDEAAQAAGQVRVHLLPDGSVKATRAGSDGACYYVVVPAVPDVPPTGVRTGTPAECEPTP